MAKYGAGVDVGGTSVKLGLFTEEGRLLEKWEILTDRSEDGGRIIPDAAASLKEALAKRGIPLSGLLGAGIGVPGPVQPDGFVERCVNLGWRDRYPARELSELLCGCRAEVGNDANVAALGEAYESGVKNAVMITLGTGVGGGVILDGRIVAGCHGLGGEIGHIHVRDEETEACNCGARGCLEQVASATGIVREAKRVLARDPRPSVLRDLGDGISAKAVCDAGRDGDPVADEIMETVARYLGLAVSHTALLVDPELFIIGGGVSRAGDYLIDKIQKHYDHFTRLSERRGRVTRARLGNDAGIYGAVRLIL